MSTFRERMTQLYEEAKDKNHKLTQTAFAARFGATRNQLKGWLDGRGEPGSEILKQIASCSNTSVDWLVGLTDIRTPVEGLADDPRQALLYDLPEEARQKAEEFRELLLLKYGQKK